MPKVKLEPCPFCGSGDVGIEVSFAGLMAVACEQCSAQGPIILVGPVSVTTAKKHAASKWNKRSKPEAPAMGGPAYVTPINKLHH